MDDHAYRRLCMTSVCGAILIPSAMALVSELAADEAVADSAVAIVASATTGATGSRAGNAGDRRTVAQRPSPDRTTR